MREGFDSTLFWWTIQRDPIKLSNIFSKCMCNSIFLFHPRQCWSLTLYFITLKDEHISIATINALYFSTSYGNVKIFLKQLLPQTLQLSYTHLFFLDLNHRGEEGFGERSVLVQAGRTDRCHTGQIESDQKRFTARLL